MALTFHRTSLTADERTLQLRFDPQAETPQPSLRDTFLPAEWHPQSGVQLTWPHAGTDWQPWLADVTDCYLCMAYEIASRENLLVVTPEPDSVRALLTERMPQEARKHIRIVACSTNDTWARDHGFITLLNGDQPLLLDYRFNGWGQKFAANWDNQINRQLMNKEVLTGTYVNLLDFVLEGGSIESDGQGTLLTTSACLTAPNRNEPMNRTDIEERLKRDLHVDRVLWLDYGYLAGDDTDSHVDTLARLCSPDTIAYVQCTDSTDEHYEALHLMEEQLRTFRTAQGEPYKLIPLPMPDVICDEDGERLPATYANFLILNGAVLMPTYAQPTNDEQARRQLQKAFPHHDVRSIDCRVLIRQHGSLHCCTMQFPHGVLK